MSIINPQPPSIHPSVPSKRFYWLLQAIIFKYITYMHMPKTLKCKYPYLHEKEWLIIN